VTSNKSRISATLDQTLKDQLDNKTSINKSQLIETLLREYLAHGESTTVALKVRREELRRQRDNKELQKQTIENEIESLEKQIGELTQKIKERREAGLEGVSEIVEKVKDDEINADFIDKTNPLIKDQASQAGVPPQRYAQEVLSNL